jgi:hypothetical protein
MTDVTPAGLVPQGEARRAGRGSAGAGFGLGDPAILSRAALDAVRKLNPARLVRNPVIFTTEVVSALVTALRRPAATWSEGRRSTSLSADIRNSPFGETRGRGP